MSFRFWSPKPKLKSKNSPAIGLRLEALEGREVPNANFHNLSTGGPFRQDWASTGLITVNDNWDNVESIIGFLEPVSKLVLT